MNISFNAFLFFCLFIISGFFNCYAQIKLVENNQSNFKIVISPNDSSIEKSAKVLQKYLSLTSNVEIPIEIEKSVSYQNSIHVGPTEFGKSIVGATNFFRDGYVIQSSASNIIINSNSVAGVRNGVYRFLNQFLNVELLTPGVVHYKPLKNIVVPSPLSIKKEPAFTVRDIFNEIAYNEQFTEWYGLTHIYKHPPDWGLFAHTFFRLVPPAKYFKSHPEYFYVKDGKPTQLNITNNEVKKIIINELEVLMNKSPGMKFWMIGQEDVGAFCEGQEKIDLFNKYGSYSDALVVFINDIAKEFPDKILATFAYHETLIPPIKTKPAENVLICYAPIDAYQQEPYLSSKETQYATYLRDWSSITKHLMVWDYPENYSNTYQPYPTIFNVQPNIQFFKESGVDYLYLESNNKIGGDLKELRTYLYANLIWNPELNTNATIANFCQKYYGKAAADIISYINAVHKTAIQGNDRLRFFGGTTDYLSIKNLLIYDKILASASKKVENDEELLLRVNKVRMGVDYLVMEKRESGLNLFSKGENARKNRLVRTAKDAGIPFMTIRSKPVKIEDIK